MLSIYLSPSVQEFNPYIIDGNEEAAMNQIADAMVPYLRASGISFERNNPYDTFEQVIEQSNQRNYDLHLALHSNAAPEQLSGQLQGPDVYYYAGSARGGRAAQIIANNLESIYPNPSLVATIPTTQLNELRMTSAPAVLVEIGYHDNWEDANWIVNHIQPIARNLVLSLADYFSIPFVEPKEAYHGTC